MSGKEDVAPLKDEGNRWQVVCAGGIAGLVSRFAIAPLDVVKIRLQLQPRLRHPTTPPPGLPLPQPLYTTTLSTLLTILRTEGVRALWKGNLPAEALYVLYGATQFTSYRLCASQLAALPAPYTPSPTATSFLAGATAGTLATACTYPLDLLRTRFAAQGARPSALRPAYASLRFSVSDILAREGPRGFFRGLGAGLAQIFPYMGLFFSLYEGLRPALAPLPLMPLGGADAAAGVLASIVSKTAVFPLDTVRKRLQVQGPTRASYVGGDIPAYRGVLGTVRAVVAREGARGLYRGLGVSLIKAAPASAVTMWTYERAMGALVALEEAWAEE
ncbi:uncharacterized protein K452DRAFT_66272 [Aplosporella prunicola CBS 121167]|uniref:Mitochondrial thiamine pyrophosphate carrier 1 n=1 Tax=Aplosporella prunicola CBS 121167 TaxID=1176127 RepID=A0A6A6BQT3_9PEZI|nr:uncharacterized protein K452DRAFT_66272 [Aplosporella prunicola CBS 121167]KAF2146479.1 hypothetical protein K452DRAFT_66272 [Aplosporella prunicola CBS 121167]